MSLFDLLPEPLVTIALIPIAIAVMALRSFIQSTRKETLQ